jgi:hypothetical protein
MPSVPEELPAFNEYDDNSFIEDRNCSRLQPADVTCAPSLPATDERGYHFQLLHINTRALRVKELPNAPIDFFLSFIPYSLVERWVQYTNSWVTSLLHERTLRARARLRKWKPTTTPEIYVFLAILIYIGIFQQSKVQDFWKTSGDGHQRPDHSIIEYMTFNRWWLLFRHIRIFSLLDPYDKLPRTF